MRKKTKRKTTKKTQEFIVAVMDKKTKEKHFFSFENNTSQKNKNFKSASNAATIA